MSSRKFTGLVLPGVFMAMIIVAVVLSRSWERTRLVAPDTICPIRVPGGDLRVVYHNPQGTLSSDRLPRGIVVTFSLPIVSADEAARAPVSPPLRIEPALPGKFRWIGTRALAFYPEQLPLETTVRVTVDPSVHTPDGRPLAAPCSWTFHTPERTVSAQIPTQGAENVALDAPILLAFTYPIPPELARSRLILKGESSEPDRHDQHEPLLDLRPASVADLKNVADKDEFPLERTLVARATEPLREGYTYRLSYNPDPLSRSINWGNSPVTGFSTKRHLRVITASKGKHDPDEAVSFEFSNGVSYRELIRHLTIHPPAAIRPVEDDTSTETEPTLNLRLLPRTRYTLTVSPDLRDAFGNRLGSEFRTEIATTDLSEDLTISNGEHVMESYLPPLFPVSVRNIRELRVRLARVSRDDIVPMLGNFESDRPFEKLQEKVVRLQLPHNVRQVHPLDLRPYLEQGLGHVMVRVARLIKRNGPTDEQGEFSDNAYLQVTNLGLVGKFAEEKSLFWVTHLKDASPAPNVALEIRSSANRVLWRGHTDAQGLAVAPGSARLTFVKEKENEWIQYVVAQEGNDTAVLCNEWSSSTHLPDRFWSSDESYSPTVTFTERGLYRPGEEVHVKGIARRHDGEEWEVPTGEAIRLTLQDSRQQEIETRDLTISEFGSWNTTFKLPSDAPTGSWTLTWKATGPRKIGGSTDFRVETYKPVQFEVKVRAAKTAYTRGEELRARVTGAWLFGGAMAGAPVKWSVTARPTAWSPRGWDDFEFGAPRWYASSRSDGEGDQPVATGQGTLDAQGSVEVTAALRPDQTRRETWEATVEGVATAPNQVEVAGRQTVLVHPGDLFLGTRLVTSFVPSRQPQAVQVVAVDREGHPRPGTVARVSLVFRDWRSVRRVSHNGGTSWVSEPAETVFSSQDVACGARPSTVTLTPPRAGSYVVRVTSRDSNGRLMLSDTEMYAWGDDGVGWRRYQDDRLEVVSDRRSYKAGDVAHLLVQSPFRKARALVTIEQGHVLQRFVTEVVGSAPRIDVPIRAGYAPNVFVSVALVRGRVAVPQSKGRARGDDVGRPSFKMGYVALGVGMENRRLKLTVRADRPVAQPGEDVTVDLELRDPQGRPIAGEIAFAAVDKGVLNLIGYHFPDPVASLFAPRSLGVSTAENLRCIIGERQVGEKGHPGGDGGQGGAMSGKVRWDQRTTASWEPALRTDAAGRARVRFKMPDNVTTFRLMALAQTTDTRFGGAEGEVVVRKPLMLTASSPRFCLVGDHATCGVMVHNQSDRAADVKVTLDVTGAHVDNALERSLHLGAGASTEVRFPFVPDRPGSTRFTFTASATGMQDALRIDIPVGLPRAATLASRLIGVSPEGLRAQVDVPADAIPGSGRLEITAASSALVGLKPCLRFLAAYPYECMEQKMSRIAPFLAGGPMLRELRLGIGDTDEKRMRQSVADVLAWMGSCQQDSGGISLYPNDRYVSPFVTVYALEVMARARRQGFDVNKNTLAKAVEYTRALLSRSPLKTEWEYPFATREALSVQAYAVHALILHEVRDFAALGILYGRRAEMGLFGRAHLLGAVRRVLADPTNLSADTLALWRERHDELHRSLADRFRQASGASSFVPPDADSDTWIYDSRVRSTAVAFAALVDGDGDPGFEVEPVVRWLVDHCREPRWLSTQDQVALLGALGAYYQRYEKETPNFAVTVLLGGTEVGQALFAGRSLSSRQWEVPMTQPGQSQPLDMVKRGQGSLHYDVRLRYATRFLDPVDHGIYVEKRIEPVGGGGDTGRWRVGDLLRVTVRVVVPDDRKYVVVDDPLPAGLEVVDQSFDTEARNTGTAAETDSEDGEASKRRPWWSRWSAFTRQESYDDRVLLFGDLVSPGVHTTSYLVRATHRGTWLLPATHASSMYAPEIYGNSIQRTIEVQ